MFNTKKNNQICDNILSTIKQAANGYLEVRVKDFDQKSKYAPIAHALNDLLDQIEVWQREISSSIDAAFESRKRNVYEAGFNGLFLSTARKLKDANTGIATSITVSKQNELAMKLEQLSKSAAMVNVLNESLESSKQNISNTKDAAASVAQDAAKSLQSVHALQNKSAQLAELVALNSELNTLLDSKAQEISNILGMVKDITDQTQLLSLNAAIEAARAGEHGRGFAVVADEVGKLAASTQQATNTIGANVASLKDSVAKCVDYSRRVQKLSSENEALVSELNAALAQFEQLSRGGASSAETSYSLQNQLYLQISLLLYKNNIKESLLNHAVSLDEALAQRIESACTQSADKAEFSKINELAKGLKDLDDAKKILCVKEIEERLVALCVKIL